MCVCSWSSIECSMMTAWGRSSDVFLSRRMALSSWRQVKSTPHQTLLFRPNCTANRTTSFHVALVSISWVRGDRRKHHEHHLHLFQKEHEEVKPSGKRPCCWHQNARADLTLSFRPVAHLPCPTKATLAVRCCPVYFELRTKKEEGKDAHWVAVSRWVGGGVCVSLV